MSLEHETPSNEKHRSVQWDALADVADALALVVNEGGRSATTPSANGSTSSLPPTCC